MARKQIERSLPPVETAFGPFAGFEPAVSRRAVLLRELRAVARRYRSKEARPFYAMRDIALHFGVPLRTVAVAYEELELEGLLNRIRGSRTMLIGRTLSPRRPIRALIGIPLWLHAIVLSPYSRLLHVELGDRLRQCGFVADFIFFRSGESFSPEFARRLLQHNLDYVIWHTPHPSSSQVILSLKDNGVRQILVQGTDATMSLALPTYYQDWQSAYHEMAADWRRNGIRDIILPGPIYAPSMKALKSFDATMRSAGLNVSHVQGSALAIRDAVCKLPQSSTAVAFLDQTGADIICNEEPVIMEEILTRYRGAFCRGPLRVPYFQKREVSVDLVRFSVHEVAGRIVQDIRDGLIPGKGCIHTFRARYESRVSMGIEEEL